MVIFWSYPLLKTLTNCTAADFWTLDHTSHGHADPENSAMGPDNGFFYIYIYKLSTYFTEDRTNLPREAIGPEGSNCSSRGVRTSISKETYSHL